MKLFIEPDLPRPTYLDSSVDDNLNRIRKPVVEVVADFLGVAYKHALTDIEKTTKKDVNKCQKDFVLSVPMVWSNKSKEITLKV